MYDMQNVHVESSSWTSGEYVCSVTCKYRGEYGACEYSMSQHMRHVCDMIKCDMIEYDGMRHVMS